LYASAVKGMSIFEPVANSSMQHSICKEAGVRKHTCVLTQMIYCSETESQPDIGEWGKHISEYDTWAYLLLSEPDQVDKLLNDLMFI